MSASRPEAGVGVIGGSGFYAFLDDVHHVKLHTPYGPASAPVALGEVAGTEVAFLPRHGVHHDLPPHRVNYRANLWALREFGVHRVIGACAAGSLRADIHPGDMVVCDQLVDRTWGRSDTFFQGGQVGHVAFADPYCPELSQVLVRAAAEAGVTAHGAGTVVVIQGPRFSTRAEAGWYRSAGWHLVNMTQYPEAALARELGICYSGLAMVTDYDTGLEGVEGIAAVTMASALEVLADNIGKARHLLLAAIPGIPATFSCHCREALDPSLLGLRPA